jgi:hypothetical protein
MQKERREEKMLYGVKSLKGYTIGAEDGDIGKLDDFYFDDEFWTIRYLIVHTGSRLQNRKVLISPFALNKVNVPEERIDVALTMKQVEKSPGIDTDKPVSRRYEASYLDYYDYPYYWEGDFLWGPLPHPLLTDAERKRDVKALAKREEAYDSHLRSINRVTGYHIEGTDGGIGHVEDFVANSETWEIRYMVVDTRNWWVGKKVLIAPPWVDRVSWDKAKVHVRLTREAIENAPEHRPEAFSRTYEETLYNYYKQPKSRNNRVSA